MFIEVIQLERKGGSGLGGRGAKPLTRVNLQGLHSHAESSRSTGGPDCNRAATAYSMNELHLLLPLRVAPRRTSPSCSVLPASSSRQSLDRVPYQILQTECNKFGVPLVLLSLPTWTQTGAASSSRDRGTRTSCVRNMPTAGWQKRYFVLRKKDCTLSWYLNVTDKEPRDVVDLNDHFSCDVFPLEEENTSFFAFYL